MMGRERPGIFEILGQAGYYIEWAKPALSERATPHHTAALAIPGERTGVVPEFGERGFLKSQPPGDDLPGTVHFISASGRALDCGRQKGEFKSPCLLCFAFSFCYTAVLLYNFKTEAHGIQAPKCDFYPQSTKEGILILTDEQLHGHMGAL